jgi:hypothetical protein
MHISTKETRFVLDYEGARRTTVEKGKLVHRDQRAFAAPPGAIRWMKIDQARCIDHGYFLERVLPSNRIRVLPLQNGRWTSDAEVMATLEHEAFNRDSHAMRAIAFIEQQDRFGYSGVWEGATGARQRNGGVEFWTATLIWYRHMKRDERAADLKKRQQCARASAQRWGKAAEATPSNLEATL